MHQRKNSEEEEDTKDKQVLVDEEGETFLDVTPMKKKWKECDTEVVTYVEHELSPVFYLFLLVSLFLFGWTFIFLLPFAYLLLQNVVHRCSQCLNEIGTRHMFGLPDFSKDILTLRLGKSMIIVVQKKVGIAIFSAVILIFLYFSWFYNFGALEGTEVDTKESIEIAAGWEEFHEDWGSNVILSNGIRANEIFNKKYHKNIVNWSGYFIDYRKSQSITFGENSHSINILIKMEPSETETEPDIVLSISGTVAKSHKDLIEGLEKGDEINFRAKFMALGDELKVNHLHTITLTKTGLNKQLPDIIINESGLPNPVPENPHSTSKDNS